MSKLKKGGIFGGITAVGLLAVATVGPFEGVRTVPYPDIIGVPTVCYGETKGVKLGGPAYTLAKCKEMLVDRLDEFADQVEACVTRPMSGKTEVAFVSLAYNIGSAGFCRSSVVRLYNAGDGRGACNAMVRFNRAGGNVVAGLARRREAERKLCLEGLP